MIPAIVLSAAYVALMPANTPEKESALLERAEEALARGLHDPSNPEAASSFAAAAAGYEELCSLGAENASLRRNEGNAYLLADNVAAAILAYRLGLQLAPGDREMRAGLTAARQRVVYPPGHLGGPPADWPAWLFMLKPGLALVLVLILYSLGWLVAVRWWLVPRQGLVWMAVVCWLGALFSGATLFLEAREQARDRERPVAVLARDGVVLRRGNGEAYPPAYDAPLNRGVEARLRFVRDEWVQIELSGGEVGWVPRQSVLDDAR